MPKITPVPSPPFRFSGVTSPNTTQVPDQYLDELLPILSGGELKVLLYITRRTFGFKKASDNISLSQMLNGITTRDGRVLDSGCGLSKKTLLGAIRSLEEMNIILTEQRSSAERGYEPTAYFLNINGGYQPQKKEVDPLGGKLHQGGGVKTTPRARGKNSPIQHTVEQHTDFESSKGESGSQESDSRDHAQPSHSLDKVHQTRSSAGLEAIGATIAKRKPIGAHSDDRSAIAATISQFAHELGDKAPTKSSITRAVGLFEASGLHRDVFIDALHQAKGEVKDRRHNPGKAPLPRNQMAYFFAVVEDRLGREGGGE
jgi:hypothetical protein